MKTLIIGHRGVGKSSLLKRLRAYHKNSISTIDLDELIEKGESLSVSDIFAKRGEDDFRELEKKYLDKALSQSGDHIIAVGAGFQLSLFQIPRGTDVLWVRRPTDSSGRIFLDRPRLNDGMSAFDEYKMRFSKRESLYERTAHDVFNMDEGFDLENEPERKLIANEISSLGFDITVTANAFKRDFMHWYMKRSTWGIRFFELRDDLLTQAQMKEALKLIPAAHVLYSLRSLEMHTQARQLLEENATVAFDWANELGDFHGPRQPGFLSLHHAGPRSFAECLSHAEAFQAKSPSTLLKIALPVLNYEDLKIGHDWMMQDQARRIFLPMSPEGRWSWYRLWQSRHLKLNFMREDAGSAADQPTLLQVLRAQRTPGPTNFAAVLGQPVKHSRTPAEQGEFFSKRGWPVYQIDIAENEWATALPFLRKLGLKAAAVTSPLKLLAFEAVQVKTEVASALRSVNTLWFGEKLHGHNTDKQGFEVLLAQAQSTDEVGVWGGGGTLELIRSLKPGLKEFSARTGRLRDGGVKGKPATLIWAVSRARFQNIWPHWNPSLIIDLNYGDDSPGRELALKSGARYISGIEMFTAQAQGQRDYWKSCEESENASK